MSSPLKGIPGVDKVSKELRLRILNDAELYYLLTRASQRISELEASLDSHRRVTDWWSKEYLRKVEELNLERKSNGIPRA